MEESTALWLLGLAHSECEAMRSELDSTYGCRKAMALDLDAARKEVDALRVERMTLRDERDAARAEAETLRAELDALKAPHVHRWVPVGDTLWVHTGDHRAIFRWAISRMWTAWLPGVDMWKKGSTAADVAIKAGWLDFPGASDHSAGAP